jgi:hypothetical protein
MAINFLNTVDFTNIPTEGFALENLGTDPPVSQEGSLYYNTENDTVKVRTAAGWVRVGQNYSFDISDGTTTDDNQLVAILYSLVANNGITASC